MARRFFMRVFMFPPDLREGEINELLEEDGNIYAHIKKKKSRKKPRSCGWFRSGGEDPHGMRKRRSRNTRPESTFLLEFKNYYYNNNYNIVNYYYYFKIIIYYYFTSP